MARDNRARLGILGIAVLIAALVLVVRHEGHSRPAGTRIAAPPAAASTASPTTGPAAATAGNPSNPAALPPSPGPTSEIAFLGDQLPVSPVDGPKQVTGDLVSGFLATRYGLALAALHYSMRASPDVGPSIFTPTIDTHVAGDATAYLETVQSQYAETAAAKGIVVGNPLETATAVPAGYRIDEFSTTQPCTVHLLLGMTGSTLLVDVPVTMLFTGGDWKLLPPPTGSFTGDPVTSASGYTPFAP